MRNYQKKTEEYVYIDICVINLSDSSVADRTYLRRSHIYSPDFKIVYDYNFGFYIYVKLS